MDFASIWKAIDELAHINKISVSAMAKKAGLDPTTFNKSKRVSVGGRQRWPSMESLHKVLESMETNMIDFIALGYDNFDKTNKQTIPLLGFAQAGRDGFFDDSGFPHGSNSWDGIDFPKIADENAYAIEVSGDSMEPAYRNGDILVVSPSASIRRGDRVVVKTVSGEVMVKELKRQTALKLELKSLNPLHDDLNFNVEEISWIARVLWVSQ